MCRRDGSVADRVAGLAAAVDSLAEVDPAQLPAGVQLDLLRQVWPLLCQLDAQVTRIVGAVNAQGSAAQDGAVSTVAWLRSRLHAGGAAPRVQVAKALADLPDVAAAFDRGEISFTHARIAAKTARDLDPEALDGGVGKLLAEQAAAHPPAVFARAALRIRDHFNPDAADKRGRHPELDQWLDVDRTFRGAVSVSGLLAPDSGELLLQTLGAFMRPVNPDDLIPATARRAEALTEMCRAAADQAPRAGGHKPQVAVTIDWQTLRGQTNSLFNSNGAWSGATLGSGAALHPDTARRLACDCSVLPAVLGSASEPLDVGRLQRLVSPAIRRALNIRDGGCRFPGCDRPATWCDAHHLISWIHGGQTSLTNMILLCRRHHVLVHEYGWGIRLDHDTGIVTAHDPTARPLDVVSHPRAHSP
jgi:Domain of unknown function (DUF222)/HNH endonuclease